MKKMNNRIDTEDAKVIFESSIEMAAAQDVMRNTPEAKNAIAKSAALTESILKGTENAKTIEELIHLEMVMQRVIDKPLAQTSQEKAGIRKAESSYRALADNVRQMRDNPAEYFRSNKGDARIEEDIHKIPKWRCSDIIQGNRARMQNRANFAPEDQREIWAARFALADRTERMYKTLHKNIAADYERELKIREESEHKQRESPEHKGKGRG